VPVHGRAVCTRQKSNERGGGRERKRTESSKKGETIKRMGSVADGRGGGKRGNRTERE